MMDPRLFPEVESNAATHSASAQHNEIAKQKSSQHTLDLTVKYYQHFQSESSPNGSSTRGSGSFLHKERKITQSKPNIISFNTKIPFS